MRKNIFEEKISGKDYKFGVVVARFNPAITDSLKNGCLKALMESDVVEENIDVYNVPGAFEIPLVSQKISARKDYDAIICLGAVIKGETPHFQYVSKAVTDGILRVGLDNDIPVLFGVLITENISQAEQRAGDDEYNKGREAALSALEMVKLIKTENLV